jgi:hypothetical protein
MQARYLEPHKGVTVHTIFFFSFEFKYSLKLSPCFEVCLPLGPNYKELRESLTKKRTPSTNMHKAPMIVKYNAGDHHRHQRDYLYTQMLGPLDYKRIIC